MFCKHCIPICSLSFEEQKFLNFDEVKFVSLLFLWIVHLVSYLRHLCLTQGHKDLILKVLWFYFFSLLLSSLVAAPAAYGSSWARGRATDTVEARPNSCVMSHMRSPGSSFYMYLVFWSILSLFFFLRYESKIHCCVCGYPISPALFFEKTFFFYCIFFCLYHFIICGFRTVYRSVDVLSLFIPTTWSFG